MVKNKEITLECKRCHKSFTTVEDEECCPSCIEELFDELTQSEIEETIQDMVDAEILKIDHGPTECAKCLHCFWPEENGNECPNCGFGMGDSKPNELRETLDWMFDDREVEESNQSAPN